MDTVMIPSENVPAEFKTPCEQILKRARELKGPEPVVAYWASYSAAQRAIKVPNRSNEGTKWLMSLLDALEEMKAALSSNEAVTSEAAGSAYVENFALKVFLSADNDDRNGNTGKATIRKFVVAGQFIEILRCFENGMTEEMEQKLQYARWKAADGAKALREGRTPSSGPPIPEETEDPFPSIPSEPPSTSSSSPPKDSRGSFSSSTRPSIPPQPSPNGSGSASMPSPRPSPAHVPQKTNLPSIDTTPRPEARTPKRTHSSTSVAWSTVATPGLADDDDDRQFNLPPSKVQPSAPTEYDLTPTGSRSPGEKKNVRFMGPDGAPLSPAQTVLTVDSYDTPDAPPPSTFSPAADSPKRAPMGVPRATDSATANGRPRGDSSSSMTRPSVPPASGQPSSLRPQGNGRSRGDSISRNTNPVPPPPPPSLASYPSQPPSQPNSNGLGLSSPPPSAPPAVPTRKQVEQTQKHARWAVSALDFDDYETARAELRRALAVLGG